MLNKHFQFQRRGLTIGWIRVNVMKFTNLSNVDAACFFKYCVENEGKKEEIDWKKSIKLLRKIDFSNPINWQNRFWGKKSASVLTNALYQLIKYLKIKFQLPIVCDWYFSPHHSYFLLLPFNYCTEKCTICSSTIWHFLYILFTGWSI